MKSLNDVGWQETAIEAAPLAIVALDSSGIIVRWNAMASSIFGLPSEMAKGTSIGGFVEVGNILSDEYWSRYRLQGKHVEEVTRCTSANGESFPAHVVPIPANSDSSDIAGYFYILRTGKEVYAIETIRRQDIEQQRAELLNGLIDGAIANKETAIQRGHALGLDLALQYALFCVNVDEYAGKVFGELQKDQRGMKDLLRKVTGICSAEIDKIVWGRYDGFVVLCPMPNGCCDVKSHSLERARFGKDRITGEMAGLRLTVGVSSSYSDIMDIKRCYREAKEAATVGQKIWGGNGVYHYADLGICQLLTQFEDSQQLQDFVDRALGKLMRHDEAKGTQLVQTLEEILTAPNLKEAAEKSFVHHKTMMFRKNRIEEILGMSLEVVENRLTLATALKIRRLFRQDK